MAIMLEIAGYEEFMHRMRVYLGLNHRTRTVPASLVWFAVFMDAI